MFHNSAAVLAVSREPNPTHYQKTLALNDFYLRSPGYDFPLGGIQMVGKSQAPMYRGEKEIAKLAPMFTLDYIASHAVDFWLTTEDLPRPDNRVTVGGDGNIHLSYTPTNQESANRLLLKLKSMLGRLRLKEDTLARRNLYMKNEMDVTAVAHQAGTCRFGNDPKTSVLDRDCKAHQLDNLYVVDTSFFPSIGAVNPALTAMANALRIGDHLLKRLG
jgi:choline dehydrogenase-like flavoprotein